MRALIVDDEMHVTEGLKTMIRWREFGVEDIDIANNGEDALELFNRQKPDIIITDVYMPKMDGLEFIKKIRNSNPDLPVIILSGYNEFNYASEAIGLGVVRYLLKPSIYSEIEQVIKETIDELNIDRKQKELSAEFNSQIEENLPVIQKYFLNQMLTVGIDKNELPQSMLDFYRLDRGINIGGLVICIKLYRPDNIKSLNEREWHRKIFAAARIADDIVNKYQMGYVLQFTDDKFPIILFGEDFENLVYKAKQIADEIITNIELYIQLEANAGIGSARPGIAQYPFSSKEAADIISLCEEEGYHQVLCMGDVKKNALEWPKYPLERMHILSEALLKGDDVAVFEKWQEIERILTDNTHVPLAYIQTLCIGIMNSLALKIIETDSSIMDPNEPLNAIQEIQKQKSKGSTMSLMNNKLHQLVELIQKQFKNNRHNKHVRFIQNYVAEHYSEEISFASLAREMNLARNYLSNIFKRETGISFMCYLTNFRINRAKELLITNTYMSYEVAEMVGYNDPTYFSRIFKQVTGCSPLEYIRQSVTI